MGAIYLVNNLSVGPRTKHIDVRYHFIRQHKENGDLQMRFTRGDANESDIATKNVVEKLHVKFATNIREGRMQSWTEWNETVSYAEAWEDVLIRDPSDRQPIDDMSERHDQKPQQRVRHEVTQARRVSFTDKPLRPSGNDCWMDQSEPSINGALWLTNEDL